MLYTSIVTILESRFRIGTYDMVLLVMMVTSTLLLFVWICFPRHVKGLFPGSLFASRKMKSQHPNWNEDELFMENFRELYKVLQSNSAIQLMETYNQQPPHVTHFCFLVHGYSGFSKDLSYLEAVMRLFVEREKYTLAQSDSKIRQDMIVHTPICNENKTKDGVRNGGERLLNEIFDVIRSSMMQQTTDTSSTIEIRDITISFLGNSLGGLYCRYAISRLAEETDDMILDGRWKLHFNIFCTTASPHLGISKHTYFPIPRAAEIGVAHTMGETGKDLFRVNGLLKAMATTPKFLKPLQQFRKRIAYANAFATDFPVPTATAAFLHANSLYPHYSGRWDSEVETDTDCSISDDDGLVVGVFHTRQEEKLDDNADCMSKSHHFGESGIDQNDDLALMSYKLDSLGWKKVFVDLRSQIPIGMNMPRMGFKDETGITKRSNSSMSTLSKRKVVGSFEVAESTRKPPDLERISLPLGHNMIVAFSRDQMCTTFYKGGRPLVDSLAKEIVGSIFEWKDTKLD